jgi:hypothetical protein
MLVRAPLVQAKQDSSIGIQDLTKIIMARGVSGWPKRDWYHLQLPGTSLTPMTVHMRFIAFLLMEKVVRKKRSIARLLPAIDLSPILASFSFVLSGPALKSSVAM